MSKAHIPPTVAIKGHITVCIRKREKRTNKGTDKHYLADSSIHSKICHIYHDCTKFQTSRSSNSLEIFDENFHNQYIGVKDRKRKKKKKKAKIIGLVNSNKLGCLQLLWKQWWL